MPDDNLLHLPSERNSAWKMTHSQLVELQVRYCEAVLPIQKTTKDVGLLWRSFEAERKTWQRYDVVFLMSKFMARLNEIESDAAE